MAINDLKGTIKQFKELKERLKHKEYDSSIEKAYLEGDYNNLKREISNILSYGFKRQEKVKLMLRSIGFNTCNKAIFRMNTEKTIKTWDDMERFEAHMLRIYNTPNANSDLIEYDTVLKGDRSPAQTLEDYYLKYNLKQNGKGIYASRLVTELIYTVSPKFFLVPGTNKFDFKLIEEWVTVTMSYLEAQFPDGQLVWAMLHMSESTPHIHVLVCGREYHEKWKKEIPSHNKFFGAKSKLRNLQSNYANSLQRAGFLVQRGLQGSKATHKEVSRWRAEQREKDKRLLDQEEILRKKDIESKKIINKIKEKEAIERKARNKVLRDLCEEYKLDPLDISKAIEHAKKLIRDDNKGVEKKIDE